MVKQNLLTKLLLLFALIVGSVSSVRGQSDFSSTYTSNITLSTTGGTKAEACKVVINETEYDGIKIGTGSAVGAMKMTIPEGTKYLHLHVSGWNNTELSLNVTGVSDISDIPVKADAGVNNNSPFTLQEDPSSDDYYKVITFIDPLEEDTELTFTTSGKKRCVIFGVNSEEASSNPSSDVTFANTNPSINFPAKTTYSQTASTASGYSGTVEYTITANTAGATLSGSTVTVTHEGSVTVKATAPAVTGFSASTATYTLTVTDTRIDNELSYATATQEVTIDETLDAPALTNPHNLTVNYESSDETIATVDASGNVTGVAAGSATITASFAGNDEYKPGSASYIVTVKKALPVGVLFWESVSGYTGSSDISSELLTSYDKLDSDNWDSFSKVYAGKVLSGDADGHLKFGSGSYAGTAVTKAIALTGNGKLTYKVQRYDSKNIGNLTISVTGATATGDVDVTGTEEWVEKTVIITGATGEVVITFETTSDDKRIRLDEILLVATPTATITSAGYATFSSDKNVDFSSNEGLTVYTATENETSVTLNEVTSKKVPANTPVVLKGAAGSYAGTVISSADDLGANDLHISDGETATAENNIYVLANKSNGVGFYKWAGTSSLSAGKIYLKAETSNNAPFLGFDGEGTTGINSVERGALSVEGCYTLDGRRVAQPTKGLYIVNGKKVIIK